MNTMPLNKTDRMRGALWGMFVGDALAMPVHWYYSIATLWQDFGQIKDYQAPKAHHPNSIMSLANTSKARRRYCWKRDTQRQKAPLGSS
jgi:ADP-ribosylglycohydrolase